MKRKSYKREVAILMWLHLVVLSFLNSYQVIELLVWPYMAFILGAFGFHSLATQTTFFKKDQTNVDDTTSSN